MKTTLLAAAAVLALGIGSAFAGEDLSSLQQYGSPGAAPAATGVGSFSLSPRAMALLRQDSGSQQLPVYAGIGTRSSTEAVMLVPSSSGNGAVETANSLPLAAGSAPTGVFLATR